jgi:hypothetical protein
VPIFAFLVGVLLSAHIKSGRAHKLVSHPLWWTMGVQAVAFAVVGFVPISFLAAMQFTLFRSIGDLTYIAVATTGNPMRFVESATPSTSTRTTGRDLLGRCCPRCVCHSILGDPRSGSPPRSSRSPWSSSSSTSAGKRTLTRGCGVVRLQRCGSSLRTAAVTRST